MSILVYVLSCNIPLTTPNKRKRFIVPSKPTLNYIIINLVILLKTTIVNQIKGGPVA